MIVYTINQINFKNKTLIDIPEDFQQKLLYFSKNYDTILKKTTEFITETDKFFKNNYSKYNGYRVSSRNQNTTPESKTINAYFFTSNEAYTIIYVSEIDVPELKDTEIAIGDFVEVVPEAERNICGRIGFGSRDFPQLFRVIDEDKDKNNFTVILICGSKKARYTATNIGKTYAFPKDYFRKVTKL